MEINFELKDGEFDIIIEISKRAVKVANGIKCEYDLMTAQMDITATHANGCKLDLDKLLNADNFNFNHDVFGIRSNINRDTGKLLNCFLPRCSI